MKHIITILIGIFISSFAFAQMGGITYFPTYNRDYSTSSSSSSSSTSSSIGTPSYAPASYKELNAASITPMGENSGVKRIRVKTSNSKSYGTMTSMMVVAVYNYDFHQWVEIPGVNVEKCTFNDPKYMYKAKTIYYTLYFNL